MIKAIVKLPAEIILWMVYVKRFEPIKQKYKVKLRFDPKFVYFEPNHMCVDKERSLEMAVIEAERVGTQDYELRFLMKDTKVLYNYHQYIKMIKTAEYKSLTKKFDGLCIMVKDKFLKLQQELADNANYKGDVKLQMPNSYVLVWLPRAKSHFILKQLSYLLQETTFVRITPLDLVWFYLFMDSFQKGKNCTLELFESENQLNLKIISPQCQQVKEQLERHIEKYKLTHFPLELTNEQVDLQEIQKELQDQTNKESEIWMQNRVTDIAQLVDKKYSTHIFKQVNDYTKQYNHSCYIFSKPDDSNKAISILKHRLENKKLEESIVKDYVIQSEENGFKIYFYNTKTDCLLLNNVFDQNDFDQFLAQYYNLSYEVKVDQVDKQLSFLVKVPFSQREIKNMIIEMLDSYVNHQFYYIVDYSNLNLNIGQTFNCRIDSFRSNTEIRGTIDIFSFEQHLINEVKNGSALVIKITNLLHSKKKQILANLNEQRAVPQSDVYFQIVNDRIQEKCKIMKLTQSHLEILKHHGINYQIIKPTEQFLEETFFVTVQYRGQQLHEAIEKCKNQEQFFLQKYNTEQQIQQIQEQNSQQKLFKVYLQEQFNSYYSYVRMKLLQDNYESELNMEKSQTNFYIDITHLKVSISHLVPIMTVIQFVAPKGSPYENLNELKPGLYLLGIAYRVNNNNEILLQEEKFVIRKTLRKVENLSTL